MGKLMGEVCWPAGVPRPLAVGDRVTVVRKVEVLANGDGMDWDSGGVMDSLLGKSGTVIDVDSIDGIVEVMFDNGGFWHYLIECLEACDG